MNIHYRGQDNRDEWVDRLLAENERLRIALADSINRPLGVVPDSAIEFYSVNEQDSD